MFKETNLKSEGGGVQKSLEMLSSCGFADGLMKKLATE